MRKSKDCSLWGRISILFLLCGSLAAFADGKCRRTLSTPVTREDILRLDSDATTISEIARKNGVRYLLLRFTQDELTARLKQKAGYSLAGAELIPVFTRHGQRDIVDLMTDTYSTNSGFVRVRQSDWMVGFIFDISLLERGDVILIPRETDKTEMDFSTEELNAIFAEAGSPATPAIGVHLFVTDGLDLRRASAVWVPEPINTYRIQDFLSRLAIPKNMPRFNTETSFPDLVPLPRIEGK